MAFAREFLCGLSRSSVGHHVVGSLARLEMATMAGCDHLSKLSFVGNLQFCSLCETSAEVPSGQAAFIGTAQFISGTKSVRGPSITGLGRYISGAISVLCSNVASLHLAALQSSESDLSG